MSFNNLLKSVQEKIMNIDIYNPEILTFNLISLPS